MKFVPLRSLVVLGLALAIGSCSGSNDGGAPQEGGAGGHAGGGGSAGHGSGGGSAGTTGSGGSSSAGSGAGGSAGSAAGAGGSAGSGGSAGAAGGTAGAAGGSAGAAGSTAGAGGATGGAAGGTAGAGGAPAGMVPSVVGVGYGGAIVLSRDAGKTWMKIQHKENSTPDDQWLLHGVAYGAGIYSVAGNGNNFTSTDGVHWTMRAMPNGCPDMLSIAYGKDAFYATCGQNVFKSTDGVSFSKIASNVSSAGHMYLVYAGGTLAVSGDDKVVYTSTDGVTWAKKDGLVGAAVCGGQIKSQDACKVGADDKWEGPASWVRSRWMGRVDASADQGKTWGPTFQDPDMNHYTAFAFGFSPG